MPYCYLLVVVLYLPFMAMGQVSDIISVQKKNGKIVKNFGAGSPIALLTDNGEEVSGVVKEIRDDSVFVYVYDIRQFVGMTGLASVDTLQTYVEPVHYRNVRSIQVYRHRGYARGLLASVLKVGGIGYLVLNVVNGLYQHQRFDDPRFVTTLSLSAAAAATGWAISKYYRSNQYSRKRHRIVYINLHQ